MGAKNVPDIALMHHMWIMGLSKEDLMIKREELMDIWSFRRQGLSFREIGRRAGLDRRTVKKHVEAEGFPEYQKRNRSSKLAHYYCC
jgi:hypothetical protein